MDSPIVSVSAARTAAGSSILTARLASAFAAVLLVLTMPLLYLVFDLLDWRGRVPEYTQLAGRRQLAFRTRWESTLNADSAIAANLNLIRPADADGSASPLQKWTWRWQATAYTSIHSRVGPAAAERYLAVAENAIASPTNDRLGILSLAAREDPSWTASVLWTVAKYAPWTWQPNPDNGTNSPYLVGLVLILVVLVTVQIVLLFVADSAALTASLDAVTRMRRSVYSHANRIGQLVVRQQLASDVAELFTSKTLGPVAQKCRGPIAT